MDWGGGGSNDTQQCNVKNEMYFWPLEIGKTCVHLPLISVYKFTCTCITMLTEL